MKINVENQVVVKDGERQRALLPSKNPHDVNDQLGKALIKDGHAERATGRSQAPAQPLQPATPVVSNAQDPERNLENMAVAELKDIAKEMEISGYGSMGKSQLIEAIETHEAEGDDGTNEGGAA